MLSSVLEKMHLSFVIEILIVQQKKTTKKKNIWKLKRPHQKQQIDKD